MKTIQIDWRKIKHIQPKLQDGNISLEIKPTTSNLPYVTVITHVNDPVLFNFCIYSWSSVLYPKELLNWVIIDSKNYLTPESLGNYSEDKRIRVIKGDKRKYNTIVSEILNFPFEKTDKSREHFFTLMECGDVWFPDTLSLKFRALKEGYDCVIADTLAYYSPLENTSLAYKLFLKYPRGGLYFKKSWWEMKSSSKIIGVPYLANSITIGRPYVHSIPVQASTRFFDNFPTDVKNMIKKIMLFVDSQKIDNETE